MSQFRVVPVVLFALLLNGCFLPVQYSIASWAMDGLSFLFTKKSLTDHGISAIAQKDCALWRTVTEGEICREDGSIAVVVDAGDVSGVDKSSQTTSFAGNQQSRADRLYYNSILSDLIPVKDASGGLDTWQKDSPHDPVVVAKAAPKAGNKPAMVKNIPVLTVVASETLPAPAILPAPEKPAIKPQFSEQARIGPALAGLKGHYLVIGSFGRWSNASRFAERYEGLGTQLVSAVVNDEQVYRILVGPYVADTRRQLVASVMGAGITEIWAMKVAENTIAIDPKQDQKVQIVFLPQ